MKLQEQFGSPAQPDSHQCQLSGSFGKTADVLGISRKTLWEKMKRLDSTNGLPQGKRVGDKFYRENGDVLQADHNAALNVLARFDDSEISRFTPYKEVRRILLARSPAQLSVKRLELGAQARQPSADKSVSSFE